MVGTVILVGGAVAVIGSLWLSGSRFGRPGFPVDVVVEDVGQLREGNAVKFRGVPVGRVEEFEVDGGGEGILIHLLLDQELPSVPDAAAVVAPESLFGEWQVEIVSRDRFPRFTYFELTQEMVEGRSAPVLPGYTLPDITRLTAAANDISLNLAVLTDRVDRAFSDETAESVRLAIENIEDISLNLRDLASSTSEMFEEFKDDVGQAALDIGAAASVARTTLERADQILQTGQLDSIVANVNSGSRDLAVIASALGSSSEEMRDAIVSADSAFARIDRVLGRIEGGQGVLGQLLTEGALVGQASSVLVQLDLLLNDLRQNPKKYVRLSIF
jgi:phospholipid/cholesterol/gamma-HCH transport system substrate-binding protein